MVELKVAAKETVKITFGGNAGWEAHSWILDDAWLSAHHQSIKNLQEESDGHMRERDQARANVAEANDKIQRANEIIGGLREELSDMQVRKERNAPTITLNIPALPLPPLTVEQVQDAIKEAVGRRLAPEWQPIETAQKPNGKYIPLILYVTEEGFVRAGYMNKCKWEKDQHTEEYWCKPIYGDEERATHWMPLPEPPR